MGWHTGQKHLFWHFWLRTRLVNLWMSIKKKIGHAAGESSPCLEERCPKCRFDSNKVEHKATRQILSWIGWIRSLQDVSSAGRRMSPGLFAVLSKLLDHWLCGNWLYLIQNENTPKQLRWWSSQRMTQYLETRTNFEGYWRNVEKDGKPPISWWKAFLAHSLIKRPEPIKPSLVISCVLNFVFNICCVAIK